MIYSHQGRHVQNRRCRHLQCSQSSLQHQYHQRCHRSRYVFVVASTTITQTICSTPACSSQGTSSTTCTIISETATRTFEPFPRKEDRQQREIRDRPPREFGDNINSLLVPQRKLYLADEASEGSRSSNPLVPAPGEVELPTVSRQNPIEQKQKKTRQM